MATEKRLIDANNVYSLFGKNGKASLHVADIDLIPRVDAVEVVRCKDCKYYEIHKPKVLENCERKGYLLPMMPDDFCSYGERK